MRSIKSVTPTPMLQHLRETQNPDHARGILAPDRRNGCRLSIPIVQWVILRVFFIEETVFLLVVEGLVSARCIVDSRPTSSAQRRRRVATDLLLLAAAATAGSERRRGPRAAAFRRCFEGRRRTAAPFFAVTVSLLSTASPCRSQ